MHGTIPSDMNSGTGSTHEAAFKLKNRHVTRDLPVESLMADNRNTELAASTNDNSGGQTYGKTSMQKMKTFQSIDSVSSRHEFEGLLLKSYYGKLTKYADLSSSLSEDAVLDILSLSQKYVRPLSTFPESRVFIGTVTNTLRSNLGMFNSNNTMLFLLAIRNFIESEHSEKDNTKFVRQIITSGLSPVLG